MGSGSKKAGPARNSDGRLLGSQVPTGPLPGKNLMQPHVTVSSDVVFSSVARFFWVFVQTSDQSASCQVSVPTCCTPEKWNAQPQPCPTIRPSYLDPFDPHKHWVAVSKGSTLEKCSFIICRADGYVIVGMEALSRGLTAHDPEA